MMNLNNKNELGTNDIICGTKIISNEDKWNDIGNQWKKEYCQKYHLKNRNDILERKRLYYIKNKNEICKTRQQHYIKNKETCRKKSLQYYFKNKEARLKYHLKYNNDRKKNDINFRLMCNLRVRLCVAVKRKTRGGSAVKDLGCSIPEFKSYLESKFQPGMTWYNYGSGGWHIDHIIPLSSFNLENRSEILTACNYKNLQPLWALDNLSKGKKLNVETLHDVA